MLFTLLALGGGLVLFEDVSVLAILALVYKTCISPSSAFAVLFVSIFIGDSIFYLLGYLAHWSPRLRQTKYLKKLLDKTAGITQLKRLAMILFVSRAIPGIRCPVNFAVGFLGMPFLRFVLLKAVSVFLWVCILIVAGQQIDAIIKQKWLPYIAAVLVIVLILYFVLQRRKSLSKKMDL